MYQTLGKKSENMKVQSTKIRIVGERSVLMKCAVLIEFLNGIIH